MGLIKSKVRSQVLIVLFNGTGFGVVRDGVFKARLSSRRKDVNLSAEKVSSFLSDFLEQNQIPALNSEPVVVGPISAVRRLNIHDRTYEVTGYVYRVPADFVPPSFLVQSFSQHQLAKELDTLLGEALSQL